MTTITADSRPRFWIAVAALVVLTFAAYAPTFRNGFVWDDDAYVTDNPALRSVDGLDQIWTNPSAVPLPQYYPLTFTTFWIEHHLLGDRPLGYHVDNVALQAINAVLLWLLLRKLEVPNSWFAAAVFAVHPVGVESVAWVTERKNLLSGLFYFLAFLVYRINAGSEVPQRPGPGGQRPESTGYLRPGFTRTRLCYAGAFCLFLLALFSKTVSASLPAAILLLAYWKTGKVRLADVLRLIPFFIAGLVMGGVTSDWEKNHVGATGPEWSSLTIVRRLLIAGRAIWFYFGKIVCPYPLGFIYPRWIVDPSQPWQWIFPICAVAVVAVLFAFRSRLGRGPLVAVLFFVGTLFPALGFADVYPMRYSFVADHFQYLAMIGGIVLVAAAVSRLKPIPRRSVQTIVLVVCAIFTAYRCLAYRDRLTLWGDTARKNPDSWMVHSNLGNALERSGQWDQAISEYLLAARLGDDVPDPQVDAARSLAHLGRFDEAEMACRKALQIDPGWAPAHELLAKLLRRRGDLTAAAVAELDAGGYAFLRSHRLEEAGRQFALALRINPADPGAVRGEKLSHDRP